MKLLPVHQKTQYIAQKIDLLRQLLDHAINGIIE